MGSLSEYITGSAARPTDTELAAILQQYPWFMTARILLSEQQGHEDKLLALHRLSHHPKSSIRTAPDSSRHEMIDSETIYAESYPQAETREQAASGMIDAFLSKGEYRIVPDERTPEFDAAEQSARFEADDELASEELAEIYLAQGLKEQAKEIYRQLSLLNPGKSVYFAEIIGEIDSK